MKRMWLPLATTVSCYTYDSVTVGGRDEWSVVAPGWVDVDTYPLLKAYCLSEHEYKLKRLMGEIII